MTKYAPLAKDFESHGYFHKQITREGKFAVYERTCIDYPTEPKHYEVIIIQCKEEIVIMGKAYPPREAYPRSETWGDLGWTLLDRDSALNKLNKLTGRRVSRGNVLRYTRFDAPDVTK